MVRLFSIGEKVDGIRPLDPGHDLRQLADLFEDAFGNDLDDGGREVVREIRMLGRLGPLSYLFIGLGPGVDEVLTGLVWEHHGQVVGNVTVGRNPDYPHRWQISNVAVLSPYRGRGIGRELVKGALDLIARRGGRTAYLFVRDDNPPALGLYRSLGFVEMDRATDLKWTRPNEPSSVGRPQALRPAKARDGELLYRLAMAADGPGARWLRPLRRSQFVPSPDERFLRWLEGLFTGERHSYWLLRAQRDPVAGAVVHRRWGKPWRVKVWVHPDRRGEVEDVLAADITRLLAAGRCRVAYTSLPACEGHAAKAMLAHGFKKIRTLILMKLDLT